MIKALLLMAAVAAATATDGTVTKLSARGVQETTQSLMALLAAKGLEAERVPLPDQGPAEPVPGAAQTTVLRVTAPKLGLSQIVLVRVWEDQDGRVWLAYRDPAAAALRDSPPSEAVTRFSGILRAIAAAATSPGKLRPGIPGPQGLPHTEPPHS